MIDFLLYYNGERPHESLGQLSPLQYLVYNGLESNMYVTRTPNWKLADFLLKYMPTPAL